MGKYDLSSTEHPSLDELDFALLRLAEKVGHQRVIVQQNIPAIERRWLRLTSNSENVDIDTPISILQHPGGKQQKAASGPLLDEQPTNSTRIKYLVKTEGGSSGSPCFQWTDEEEPKLVLIAMHNYGDPNWHGEKGEFNQGIPTRLIHKEIKKWLPEPHSTNTRRFVFLGIGLSILGPAFFTYDKILERVREWLKSPPKIDINPETTAESDDTSQSENSVRSEQEQKPVIINKKVPDGDSVKFLVLKADSGIRAELSLAELRAVRLAVDTLNADSGGGVLSTFSSRALAAGPGVNGKRVEIIEHAIMPSKPEITTKILARTEAPVVFAGAVSDQTSQIQEICHKSGALCMLGANSKIPTEPLAGNSFAYSNHTEISIAALMYNLTNTFEKKKSLFFLTNDSKFDHVRDRIFSRYAKKYNWEIVGRRIVPQNENNLDKYIEMIKSSGSNAVVLNYPGYQAVQSIAEISSSYVEELLFIVPKIDTFEFRLAGTNRVNFLGAMDWHWSLPNNASKAFVKSFGQTYGFPPSSFSHSMYCLAVLYADACQRAGSFIACDVVRALSGFEFDGLGNGFSKIQANSHQLAKEVLIVTNKKNPSSQFDDLEILDSVGREQIQLHTENRLPTAGSCHSVALF